MNLAETEGKPSPRLEGRSRLLGGCISISLCLTIILCILALCQQFYGIGLTTRHEIQPERVQKLPDYHRWKFPEHYRGPLMEQRSVLLQNERRWINESLSNRDLKRLGPGWHHWIDGGVNFIPLNPRDLADPGVRYSVISPCQFKPRVGWLLGALLIAQFLLFLRIHGTGVSECAAPLFHKLFGEKASEPACKAEVLVFLCALISIFCSLRSNSDITDHAFMLKGVPESDALAWYSLAVGLSEGHGLTGGFDNQRPFYAVYLAGLFSLFGAKLTLAQGFNALCLSLSASGLYTLGRLLHSRWLGLVLSISMMTAATHLDYVHAIITENGGHVLAVLSLLAAWRAAWGLSKRWSFAAGLLNGIAAITSGVTLLTLPLFALILTFFPLARRVAWRAALILGVVYTVAATLPIGSWIIRQKIVNGRFTLSYNTAEVLAGGADPEQGQLNPAVFKKFKALGGDLDDINSRYGTFMQLYLQTVREDPARYLAQVGRAIVASIHFLPSNVAGFHLAMLLGLFGFGLWPALYRGRWLALPVAFAVMFFWVRSEFAVTTPMLLAATYLSWRRKCHPASRLTVLLLMATVLATMLLAGLSGNVATKRFWLVSDWAAFALLLGGASHLITITASVLHHALSHTGLPDWLVGRNKGAPASSAAMDPPPFITASTLSWLALTALCSLVTFGQHLRGPHSSLGPLDSLAVRDIALQGIRMAESQTSKPGVLPEDKIAAQLCRLSDLNIRYDANEGAQHWIRIYAPRPYARWIAKLAALDARGERSGYFNVIGKEPELLDKVPRDIPFVIAGVYSDSMTLISRETVKLFEAFLIIPLKRSAPGMPWEPDFDRQILFPPTPEALAAAGVSMPAP